MNVAVFGAGYVGTVTAACLAKIGHTVWLVDSVPEKVDTLRAGGCPVVEPGLADLLGAGLRAGKVIPTPSTSQAASQTEISLVCVGTPSLPDGRPDSSQVRRVVEEIVEARAGSHGRYLVTVRSTLPYPVIVAEIQPILGRQISLALNPEFLREGSAIRDFFEPPLIVAGTNDAWAAARIRELYEPLRAPFHVVPPGTASLLKYACNAFHAAKIAFANEMASLSDLFQADAVDMMKLFCQDRSLNISGAYLRPGYAYGGSCLPKDLKAILQLARANGIDVPLLRSIPQSNQALIDSALRVAGQVDGGNIVLIGLSFKVGTDDLRESPFVELAERLIGKGYELTIYDPDVDPSRLVGRNLQYAQRHLQHLARFLSSDIREALAHTDLAIFGKPLLSVADLEEMMPSGVPVLDLTRTLVSQDAGLHLVSLDGPDTVLSRESIAH